MPKFYFSISDEESLEDTDGTDLPDAEAALQHARAVTRELTHHRDGMLGQPWGEWTMIVRDERGEEVFFFAINEAVETPFKVKVR